MRNIYIKGKTISTNLDRKLTLTNGNLIIAKRNDMVFGIYMVVSFRDNKNRYEGANTTNYCSLIDLDSGQFPFEERCSRNTTVRRVLNHLLRLGYSTQKPYDPLSTENDPKMYDCDVELYVNGSYKMGIELS